MRELVVIEQKGDRMIRGSLVGEGAEGFGVEKSECGKE